MVYIKCPENADRYRSIIWSLVTVIIGRMLLNLRGVSTPDEWEHANDANLNVILQELPVLIIGNPNRDINSQGEIIERQPTYTEESGWPENFEMARSRDEKETFWTEGHGDGADQEKSQGLGSRSSRGERRVSENYGGSYNLGVGRTRSPVASGSGSAALTPSSSPRTMVHQQRSVDSGTTEMDTPQFPHTRSSQLLTVDVGARLGWFATPKRSSFT